MTLNDFRQSGYIIWDMANKTITDNPQANGGDANGRTLKVLVKNAGTLVDLTGFDLNLGWKTSDGVHFGLDAFTAIDATQGLFEIYYTSGMLSNSGMLGAALQLVNAEGILESVAFKITVSPSIIDPLAAQSENSFTALATALVTVNGWNDRIDAVEADFIKRAIDMEAAYPQQIISLGEQLEQATEIQAVQRKYLAEKTIQNSMMSVSKSRIVFEDTASSIFTEDWSDLTAWTTDTTPGVQVVGNKLYSTGTGGGSSGANHAYALSASDNLRVVYHINLPSLTTDGGLIVGVSCDGVGAIPAGGGGNAFGLYFTNSGEKVDKGNFTANAEGISLVPGEYIVTVTVDQTYISVVAAKTDGTRELSARRLRVGFDVNNLYIFNSDPRTTTGFSVNLVSARKSLSTIAPRTFGEGIGKTVQWTGDGTQSFRFYLPKDYDSRKPSPLAICFHGNGTNEIHWGMNFGDDNYGKIQKALTDAGYIVLGCSFDTNRTTWGAIQSTNAYYEAYKYAINNYAIGSVVMFANSMGGIESLNALSENKIPCVAWAATVPTVNLKANYDNALFTDTIKGSYGILPDGSDYDAKTAGRDPNLMPSSAFRGIPMWVATPSDDNVVSKVENTDKLITKVTGVALEVVAVTVPSGGHGFDVSSYLSGMVAFYNKYIVL